jgi:23S rRNA U2552 (ribose-2'-O)-methylase RlmE/FtsJ
VSTLLESETVAALSILAPGGNFVIKMFTMFESETVCLVYLLYVAFKQIEVFKPATSKEGNSEVYVVCKDFQKTEWVDKFLSSVKER